MVDVEMADAGKPAEAGAEAADGLKADGPAAISVADIKKNVMVISRAFETGQSRLYARALRNNTAIRTRVQPPVLAEALSQLLADSCPSKAAALTALSSLPGGVPPEAGKMEVESPEESAPAAGTTAVAATVAAAAAAAAAPIALPEVEVYLSLLVVTTLLRERKTAEAAELAAALVDRVITLNRRSLDWISHKVIFYCAFAQEQLGRLAAFRPQLMSLHRTCCLRHDEMGQATTLNLLLRGLLDQNLLDQAYKLASKTTFPEGASNNQLCRYLYCMGRITALQLDYSDAFARLTQSSRKAPQNTALGFRCAVHKLLVIVQLLLGEIPERSSFNTPGLQAALAPYLQLTRAVRLGDLREFARTVDQHKATFQADRTLTLIQRLAHNVVKAGLRKLNISYSRISLEDVATKIRLDSVQSAEYIVAKAVRDGVIEAVIDHDNGYITSQEVVDVYATDEPQQAFHKRITFCLDVHNEAVRAMRYPPNAYKAELASARKGIDDKTEEELAKEIEDEMEDEGL